MIKKQITEKVKTQIELRDKQEAGEDIDPEAMMSQTELMMMMHEASFVLDTLEVQE